MRRDDLISRRALLAAGSVGAGLFGMGAVAQARKVTFERTRRILARTEAGPDAHLVVDWKEWYNGRVVGERTGPSDAPEQVQIPNVEPGDSGRLTLGLSTASEEGTPPPIEVRMRVRVSDREENGINDPEREAGDTDPTGDVQEFVEVDLWYDTGVQMAGVPLFGTCDGSDNAGDTTVATGTLGEVATTASEEGGWQTLLPSPSNPVDGGPCLGPTQSVCLTLDWAVDTDAPDVNRMQGDSVEFALEFQPRPCSQ
jgi:hypothetical protein